ncbi:hypothetical protein [Aeoliella sp.]|uniref:hypothetical protein n=1 Tax=Aeoliella sp. TaxID=2795800 RepID=UPI003CCB87A9
MIHIRCLQVLILAILAVLPHMSAANAAGRLFTLTWDGVAQSLAEIDVATGEATIIGGPYNDGFVGLTADPVAGTLIAYGLGTGRLMEFDPDTHVETQIGTLPALHVAGVNNMAYDPARRAILVENIGSIVTFDRDTQEVLAISPTEVDGVHIDIGLHSLAFDSTSHTLYAWNHLGLLAFDPATGIGTSIVDRVPGIGSGLAFDATSGLLYTIDGTDNMLVSIDPVTGAINQVSPLDLPQTSGMAFLPIPEPSAAVPLAIAVVAALPFYLRQLHRNSTPGADASGLAG